MCETRILLSLKIQQVWAFNLANKDRRVTTMFWEKRLSEKHRKKKDFENEFQKICQESMKSWNRFFHRFIVLAILQESGCNIAHRSRENSPTSNLATSSLCEKQLWKKMQVTRTRIKNNNEKQVMCRV